MKATHSTPLFIAVVLSMSMSNLHAQKIAFFRHAPEEDLAKMPVGEGTITLTAAKLKTMTAADLLEYDILYVEGTGPGWHVALEKKAEIKKAVELGLGLYIVGNDPALYQLVPAPVKLSEAMSSQETRIPMAAAWHPTGTLNNLQNLDAATAGPIRRAFAVYPHTFIPLQEVYGGKHTFFPTILVGNIGHGNVMLRTTPWDIEKIAATHKPSQTMLSWVSDGEPKGFENQIAQDTQLASVEEF